MESTACRNLGSLDGSNLFPHLPAHQHHVQKKPALPSSKHHRVQAGENPYRPNLKYHTTHQHYVRKKPALLSSKHHRVQAGENLYRTSLRYHTTIATLMNLNHLTNANTVKVGQQLKLPSSARLIVSQPASRPRRTRYTSSSSTNNRTSLSGKGFSWPVHGKVVSYFNKDTHKGITIHTTASAKVLAAKDGMVIYEGDLRNYGHLILLSHAPDNSILTVYSNTKDSQVALYQKVKKGDTLALVDSDKNNNPTLYFEIRYKGQAVDPLDYLEEQ